MREEIIFKLYPQVKSINGEYEYFDENGDTVTIDEELITGEVNKQLQKQERESYIEKRKKAYPAVDEIIGELFDSGALNYHIERKEGLRRLQQKRMEVKAKYPKPTN